MKLRPLTGAVLVAIGLAATAPLTGAASAAPAGAAFEAITPTRVLDTRSTGAVPAGGVITVPLPGALASADAVAVNVTAVNPQAWGWLTVWSGSGSAPNTSSVNFLAGETAANLAIATVDNGSIAVRASVGSDVIVDVTGAFENAGGPVSAGRWEPIAPQRALDTRSTGVIAAGGSVTVSLPIPADATAASITVTAVDADGPGYLSVTPAGTSTATSSVNYGGLSGSTRANSTLVAVNGGKVTVGVHDAGAHVLVDVSGYFTGVMSTPATDGLFVPQTPARVLDTRGGVAGNLYSNTYPSAGDTAETGTLGQVAGAVVNVTTTGTDGAGYLTSWAAGTPQPNVSVANVRGRSDTIAGAGIVPVSTRGAAVYTSSGGALIADVLGTFTGDPQTASSPAPTPRPAPNKAATAALVSRIIIPRLKLDMAVEEVAETLDPSIVHPFHFGRSALPGDEAGVVAIGGHRNDHLAPFFGLGGLQPGDEFTLVTADGKQWLYRVTVVEPPQLSTPELADRILDQSSGPGAVLFTCTRADGSAGGITHRLVVHADLVGNGEA